MNRRTLFAGGAAAAATTVFSDPAATRTSETLQGLIDAHRKA